VTVVLDSSVIIAAHVSRAGACAELYEEILARHRLILSRHIVDEVRRKLSIKFLMPDGLVTRAADALMRAGRLVEPAPIDAAACRDPHDLPILGTAVAGSAEILVTVDNDLLDLVAFESIAIVRPGQFWELTLRR
jgi:putative PIN family toxin of toxin-antitoxin system